MFALNVRHNVRLPEATILSRMSLLKLGEQVPLFDRASLFLDILSDGTRTGENPIVGRTACSATRDRPFTQYVAASPCTENRDTRNPSSRRADTRLRNPVKCVKRLRGLANATQPNELVRGSVTAGQVSASPLPIFFPTKEGRGVGGMDGLPFPDLPPEPLTTLLDNI